MEILQSLSAEINDKMKYAESLSLVEIYLKIQITSFVFIHLFFSK